MGPGQALGWPLPARPRHPDPPEHRGPLRACPGPSRSGPCATTSPPWTPSTECFRHRRHRSPSRARTTDSTGSSRTSIPDPMRRPSAPATVSRRGQRQGVPTGRREGGRLRDPPDQLQPRATSRRSACRTWPSGPSGPGATCRTSSSWSAPRWSPGRTRPRWTPSGSASGGSSRSCTRPPPTGGPSSSTAGPSWRASSPRSSGAGRWDDLATLVDDEVLDALVPGAPPLASWPTCWRHASATSAKGSWSRRRPTRPMIVRSPRSSPRSDTPVEGACATGPSRSGAGQAVEFAVTETLGDSGWREERDEHGAPAPDTRPSRPPSPPPRAGTTSAPRGPPSCAHSARRGSTSPPRRIRPPARCANTSCAACSAPPAPRPWWCRDAGACAAPSASPRSVRGPPGRPRSAPTPRSSACATATAATSERQTRHPPQATWRPRRRSPRPCSPSLLTRTRPPSRTHPTMNRHKKAKKHRTRTFPQWW